MNPKTAPKTRTININGTRYHPFEQAYDRRTEGEESWKARLPYWLRSGEAQTEASEIDQVENHASSNIR